MMKRRILSSALALAMAVGLFTIPASAAYDFGSTSGKFNLAVLTDTDYIVTIPVINVTQNKTLQAGGILSLDTVENFDALYGVFAEPGSYETFKKQYGAVGSQYNSTTQSYSSSAITDKTNLAMVLVRDGGDKDETMVETMDETMDETMTVSQDFVVSGRSAQIALKNYDSTVTLNFSDGKTIKISDGGQLLLSNASPSLSGNMCADMQLKIVLQEPIEVSGEGSALYLEPRAGLSPEALGQLGYEYARDVIVAPSGQPAIIIKDGGEVRGSRYDIVRAENDETTNVPLINVQGGELRLSSGSPSRVQDTDDGMPVYSDTPDASMHYEDAEFVMNLDNGSGTSPAVFVEKGAQATIEGGSITGSGETPLVKVAEGATLTISGENTNISTTSTTQPAVEVAEGGTIVYEDNQATVTTGDGNKQAVILAANSKVRMGNMEVTVSDEVQGNSYVNNNGVAVFAAGATVGAEDTPMNSAVLLSDGTLIEGSETEAPTVSTDERGNTTVTVPAGGAVTSNGTKEIYENSGSITQKEDGSTTIGVAGISLNYDSLTLYSNTTPDSATLTATIFPENASDETVTWTSSNDAVATVENGVVTAVGNGTATITATAGGQTATCAVTVKTYSSGSGGVTRYSVSVEDADNGTVKVSPTRASKGSTVTITVTPDEGYELDKLVVTDKNGDTVKLTDKGDRKYTFTMPRSAVTVEATFAEIATEPETPVFTDVPADAYYADAVAWAVENGITNGTSSTTFGPNVSCTRAQMVTFLWRAAGSPKPTTTNNPFTDVQSSAYYYDAVLWAVENGVTEGTSATTFSPDAVCTRAQTVTFLWRQAGAPVVNYAISFTDVDANAYYVEAVRWAVSEGVTVGTSDTTFSPDMDCTRAQIVTFMYRAAQ